jgi:hypothetical protein
MNPASPQLVYRPHHHVSFQVARLSEQIQSEVRSYRRREAGHLPGGRDRML